MGVKKVDNTNAEAIKLKGEIEDLKAELASLKEPLSDKVKRTHVPLGIPIYVMGIVNIFISIYFWAWDPSFKAVLSASLLMSSFFVIRSQLEKGDEKGSDAERE